MFKLTVYDAVGFDFDNTLMLYNLTNLYQFHYTYLTKFLVEKKGYADLPTTMDSNDVDFFRRGLFLDFAGGNVLDISADGTILSASHGTKKLEKEEISKIYGKNMRWSPTDLFIKDKLALWEGPAAEQTRTFLDYSDTTATLVFAKMIDSLDVNDEKDYSKVWPHLLEAIIDMYKDDSDLNKGLLSNMPHFVHKTETNIINFLNKLKETTKLFLLTGSASNLVKPLASYSLGADWEKFFDTIIYCAKKPGFFIRNNSFLNESGNKIKLPTSKGSYQQGNWSELYEIIGKELDRLPKCVYLGDSTIQDVYAPSIANKPIDSVSVIEEALTDGIFPGEHPHGNYVKSEFWGPYFGKNNLTVMGDIITKHSKLCIPSLCYLADKPLNFEYVPFWIRSE
ncbi:hypothetical protein O3M35_000657 [Rhynocoris fuscipes]|uniref:5'-nucleotidase domain-containing protein 1 n=1 Tax=Rhynocoris fuscipes TaxID=488301 RepID=A0AAW1DNI8_9HEMI